MREWKDDDLVLHHYGDHPDGAELAAALESSPELQARYQAIRRLLGAIAEPAPTRGADYGERVWRRLEPHLTRAAPVASTLRPARISRGRWQLLPPRSRWALAATLALALVGAYLLGRTTALPPPAVPPATAETPLGFSEEARQRILLAAVAHHLEQAEVLLVGIANHGPEPAADFQRERARAEELVSANRLYRGAAREAGEHGLVPLLGDLETLLLELAHAPVTAADLSGVQERLRERDILFKLRVVGTRLHQQLRPAGRRPSPGARA